MADKLDSLLGLDGGQEQTPGEEAGQTSDNNLEALKAEFKKLEESNKNKDEKIRQLAEQVNDFVAFKQRLTQDPEELKRQQEDFDTEQRYLENPRGFISEQAEAIAKKTSEESNKRVGELEAKLATQEITGAMREIDRDYEVDWVKNQHRIKKELMKFSPEARRTDRKGCLLAACQLTGILKKRENMSDIPHVLRGYGEGVAKVMKTEAERIRDGVGQSNKGRTILNI